MNEELKKIVALYKTAASLKQLPRQGWIMEGALLSEADTVAAHSFSVALISYLTANAFISRFPDINIGKVTIMAVFHDLGESATGEIATGVKAWITKNFPSENIIEKIEHDTLGSLVNEVTGGNEIYDLLLEYDKCDSKEAKIVKFGDVVDAFAYAKDRMKKTFPDYLKKVRQKLSQNSIHGHDEFGSLLSTWIEEIEKDWEAINKNEPWKK
jgi:putative hydrolase of HD superfamily